LRPKTGILHEDGLVNWWGWATRRDKRSFSLYL